MHIWFKIFLLIFATFFVLVDILLFLFCKKEKFNKTGLKIFIAEDFFFIGEKITLFLKRGTGGKKVRRLEEIYEPLLAGQIAKSAAAAPYTYFFLFFPLIIFIYAVSENKLAFFTLSVLVLFLMFYFDIWLKNSLERRRNKILSEFASVLSKMSLLINAGITANEAFERVAKSNNGELYNEMKRVVSETENGRAAAEALDAFAFRCGCKEVRKFVSLYKQNLVKGGPEFPIFLREMAETAWNERKARARLSGVAAEQKLLIPIMLMFIGVLIMVIIPAFNNLL